MTVREAIFQCALILIIGLQLPPYLLLRTGITLLHLKYRDQGEYSLTRFNIYFIVSFRNAAATLFNGLGRWSGNLTAPLAVVNVTQGQRYRFRLISTSCEPNYIFSIDGHNMTVIEADGVETEPLVVDSIQIYAG